jgi:hypothetical protein
MPFVPDAPETVAVPVPIDKVIDTYQIEEITIRMPPNARDHASLQLKWSKGYVEKGQYIEADSKWFSIEGGPLLEAMAAPVEPGLSHYADLRNALWQFLQAQGAVPPGTVT